MEGISPSDVAGFGVTRTKNVCDTKRDFLAKYDLTEIGDCHEPRFYCISNFIPRSQIFKSGMGNWHDSK